MIEGLPEGPLEELAAARALDADTTFVDTRDAQWAATAEGARVAFGPTRVDLLEDVLQQRVLV